MGLRRLFTRSRRERGATIVEYTLLVAVLAVGTLAAVSTLQDSAERTTEKTAERISTRTIPTLDPTNPSPTVPTTTTTTPTTTTTKPPTTTTAPTTTTTKPPTTTTTKPPATTTTKPPPVAKSMTASWQATSKQNLFGYLWQATAPLKVTNNLGQPVSGAAVVVRMELRSGSSWSSAGDLSGSTDAAGSVTFVSGWQSYSNVSQIRFTVRSVTSSGLSYSSGQIQTSVTRP